MIPDSPRGPGRPRISASGVCQERRVCLDPDTQEVMLKLGAGNLSRGIRLAATKIRAAMDAARKREE